MSERASASPDAPPARRRLLLVRHGHVDYFDASGAPVNPRDATLSARGRAEIDALAGALAPYRIDLALVSPMKRARESAQRLLLSRPIVPHDEPGFAEIRPGRLRELAPERREAEIAYPYEKANEPDARFVGGEAWQAFRSRVLAALEAWLERSGWSTALVVSHDAVNRVILAWALDAPHAIAALEQDPACLDVIDFDGPAGEAPRRKLLRAVNVTVHDPAKERVRWTWMEQVYRAWRPPS